MYFILLLLFFYNCVAYELTVPFDNLGMFGYSLALHDNIAVVGDISGSGRVYVFNRAANDTWVFAEKLGHTDASEGDKFGFSVDVSEDFIVVGAPYQYDKGRVYVYQKDNNDDWKVANILKPPIEFEYGKFGYTVSIESNSRIVVGHPGANFMLN